MEQNENKLTLPDQQLLNYSKLMLMDDSSPKTMLTFSLPSIREKLANIITNTKTLIMTLID